jgi:hypothetical protein
MLKKLLFRIMTGLFFLVTNLSVLFAEGKPETVITRKVKVEGLSGINLFLAQTYNNDKLLFAIISSGSIIILGIIVTLIISLIIKPAGHARKEE